MQEPSRPLTPRQIAHQQTVERIVTTARDQMADVGAAQLSLRAVARSIGIVPSAVYRYIASRDDLISRLIVQIFQELAAHVEQACAQADNSVEIQWQTWAESLRSWALEHPADWALVYGTPIPGYQASKETIGPAARVTRPVISLSPRMETPPLYQGATEISAESTLSPLRAYFSPLTASQIAPGVSTTLIAAMASVVGFITMELGGHLVGVAEDPGPVFTAMVQRLVL